LEIDRRRDEFVSIASHELKTPVTAIKAFAQILEKRLRQTKDTKNTYFVENINKQTDKLTLLINDLLDVSKIQAGKLAYNRKEFDFDSVLKKIIVDFQYTTETHEIINEGQTRKKVIGDADRIAQVLINLLSNAIKYSPESDKVIVRSTANNGMITVSIQDFGIGIPKEKQSRIFDRFYRVSESDNGKTGFGLGLYISSEIIRRHNGRIWVESPSHAPTKGKGQATGGSTFYFSLPVKTRKRQIPSR
jgi:signal transduction histidine kinase